MSTRALRTLLACAAAWPAACSANNPTYFPPMAPLEAGGDMASAAATVTLGFRAPTEEESAALRAESDRRGYDVPWLATRSVSLAVLYSVTNLGDRPGVARIEVNGASEFAGYDAAALRGAAQMANVQNDVAILSLIRMTPVSVEAGQTVTGSVREDDFEEAALDLDAIGRWMAVPASVLVNRSDMNPIGLERVPEGLVVPALFQVQVIFSATTRMRLEFLVRVRDEDRQLLGPTGAPFQPRPRGYMPPAVPGTMM